MKKYILMRAQTESQWDDVSFALLPYDERIISKFLSMKLKLEEEDDADEMAVWSDDVDFFTYAQQLPPRFRLKEEELAKLISLKETDKLSRPEQDIKYGKRIYTQYGIQFAGFGKHTDEKFWCDLSWGEIIKLKTN